MGSLTHLDETIAPEEVARLPEAGEIQLVDVREPHEHEAGRIAGARHIEFSELSGVADSIARDAPVVFYCRVGARSAVATQAFRASGYDAHNMDGGLVAWANRGLPLEPEDGSVAEH